MAENSVLVQKGICRFYVYILHRPDGRPCYVGKGTGNRSKRLARRRLTNPHLGHIIRNSGGSVPVTLVARGLSEEDAFELEKFLIQLIGRESRGGPLVNLTDGGEGSSGFAFLPEHRKKMSEAQISIARRYPSLREQRRRGILDPKRQNKIKLALRNPQIREKRRQSQILAFADPARRAKCAWNRLNLTDDERKERKRAQARDCYIRKKLRLVAH